MTIDTSACGRFVRVTIGGAVLVVPIGELSRLLATPGRFAHAPDRVYP